MENGVQITFDTFLNMQLSEKTFSLDNDCQKFSNLERKKI